MTNIDDIRTQLQQEGISSLSVSALAETDLDAMQWAGNELHLKTVARQIRSDHDGDTLAVRARDGTVLAKGYIDHEVSETESDIGQLATHPKLQSMGIGRVLMNAAESCIRARNKKVAVLGVETINVRAKALYDRLGYVPRHTEKQGWDSVDKDGKTFYYETDVLIMSKEL